MWRFMAVTFAFLGWAFWQLSGGSDYAPGSNSLQVQAATASPSQVRVSAIGGGNATGEVSRADATLTGFDSSAGERVEITLAAVTPKDDRIKPAKIGFNSDADPVGYKSWSNADGTAEEGERPGYKRVQVETSPDAIDAAVAEADGADVPDSVSTGFIGEEVFSLESYVMRKNGQLPAAQTASADTARVVAASGDIRSVTGNVVNMRSGPGTDFDRVGSVTKGTQIAVLEEPGNGWIKLEVVDTGEVAWMADWLVTASN